MPELPEEPNLQDGLAARPPQWSVGETIVRRCLTNNWSRWDYSLSGFLDRNFKMGGEASDEIVGNALEHILRHAQKLWDSAHLEPTEEDRFAAMLYAYTKQRVQWGAIKAQKRSKRQVEFNDAEGEDDEGDYVRPTTVVWPEQEDVVFRKQMIERCNRLPEEERAAARLVFDGASLSEIAQELGVTARDAQRRVTGAARSLRR